MCDRHASDKNVSAFVNEFNRAKSPFKLKYFIGEEHFYDELDCSLIVSFGSGRQTIFAKKLADKYKFPLLVFPSAPTSDICFKQDEVYVIEDFISSAPKEVCYYGVCYIAKWLELLYENKLKKYLFNKVEDDLELELIVYSAINLSSKLELKTSRLELCDLLIKLSKLNLNQITIKENLLKSKTQNYIYELKNNFNMYINFFKNKIIDENLLKNIENNDKNQQFMNFLDIKNIKRELFLKLNAEKNKLLTSSKFYLSLVGELENNLLFFNAESKTNV